jgi:hypothetical protein
MSMAGQPWYRLTVCRTLFLSIREFYLLGQGHSVSLFALVICSCVISCSKRGLSQPTL